MRKEGIHRGEKWKNASDGAGYDRFVRHRMRPGNVLLIKKNDLQIISKSRLIE